MTDNTQELDEIMEDFYDGDIRQSDMGKAKQAITALIKELVAEAKPEEYEDYYASNPVEKGHKMGYNEAVREFEQNLLKELEEVE